MDPGGPPNSGEGAAVSQQGPDSRQQGAPNSGGGRS
jgi:hypothetical protein